MYHFDCVKSYYGSLKEVKNHSLSYKLSAAYIIAKLSEDSILDNNRKNSNYLRQMSRGDDVTIPLS